MERLKTKEIQEFIIDNIEKHPRDIGKIAADHFKVTRPAIINHLQKLVKAGILEANGNTKARIYSLKPLFEKVFRMPVTKSLDESDVWLETVNPTLGDIPENVRAICDYGFTEMLNNVKDHSGSDKVDITIKIDAATIMIVVRDYGIGIFNKIMQHFGYKDHRRAFLELAKGRLTSDRANHSGQGIFFTSRMFDFFMLSSYGFTFFRNQNAQQDKNPGWLFEGTDHVIDGTEVLMKISRRASQTTMEVLNKYAPEQEKDGFTRTHIPLTLAKYEGEELVSRSQAKRILARAHEFKEVILDFTGVAMIGQAFADEVFRVYKRKNPQVEILHVGANSQILRMIGSVLAEPKSQLAMEPGQFPIKPTDKTSIVGPGIIITGTNSSTGIDPANFSYVESEKKPSS